MTLPGHIHFLNESDLRGDRAFVNITTRGCGSGCSYCYIDGPKLRQSFVAETEIKRTAKALLAHEDFIPGRMGTIVSLCPDSDPFKTPESVRLFEMLLCEVIPLGNPIQIPTKEVYPASSLALIARLAHRNQVVAFTSFSTLARAATVEPGAASIADRFDNFRRCRDHGVFSGLYLKPFLPSTVRDLEEFILRTNETRPDSLCVGILYSTTDKGDQSEYNHPVHAELSAKPIDDAFKHFVERFKIATGVPMFHSSVCVSAYALNRFPTPHIWRSYPSLCVGCRDCEADFTGSTEMPIKMLAHG